TQGVRIIAATRVFVENCFISGQNGSPGNGITDERSTGGFLEVDNTTITNNTGNGISVNPISGFTGINVHISNSRLQGNGASGLFVGSNVHAVVFNTVIAQNVTAGVFAQQTAGGSTEVNVDQSNVSNNIAGFQANTSNSLIRVSNSTAVSNSSLAVTAGGGQVSSYGNNQTGGLAFPSTPTAQT
ncbi:MAG: right-handed parallel beta-helix repeat-containing protein, partial [Acidobacteriota bacterium]